MTYTAETLMIQPVDAEKVQKLITESLPPLPENETYHVSEFNAFILAINCIVDKDCCWGYLDDKMHIDEKLQPIMTFHVDKRIHYIQEENGLPAYNGKSNVCLSHVGVETQLPSLVKEPISLADFLGTRGTVKPRIITNTRKFLDEINHILPQTTDK